MRRSEVKTSYHQGLLGVPMVNVKCHGIYGSFSSILATLKPTEHDFDDPLFPVWLKQHEDDEELQHTAFESACEQGWEALTRDAQEIFGEHVKVESAGRSGGWCCVRGLGDVEYWSAVDLAKWAKFRKWAAIQVSDVPYLMLSFLYLNPFERWREEYDERAKVCLRDAGVVGV